MKAKALVGFFLPLPLALGFLFLRDSISLDPLYLSLRKGPYLLFNGQYNAMTILWQTSRTPGLSIVEWGSSPENYANSSGNLFEMEDHLFSYTIKGLLPGSRIYYQVRVDGIRAGGSFMSASLLTEKTLTFYGYGDTQGGLDLSENNQPSYHSHLERAIMEDVYKDPQVRHTFVLNLGDLVECGLDERYWDQQYFNRKLRSSLDFQAALPVMVTIGNHEYYLPGFRAGAKIACRSLEPGQIPNCVIADLANAGKLYYKYFPYTLYPAPKGPRHYNDYYYCFDYGPARFISLNPDNSSLKVDSPQYHWLAQTISPSRSWNIISIHPPIWAARHDSSQKGAEEYRKSLSPLFEAKNVALVLQGHEHFYSRCLVNGITYLTIGGGGGGLVNTSPYDPLTAPYVVKAEKIHHFARFEISGKTMTVTVIAKDGDIIDAFKILPPATNVSPADGAPTTLTPILVAAPLFSQDGSGLKASQWIIRDEATGRIVYITNANGVPCFDENNLTNFAVPKNILQPLHTYKWQVIYKDSNGNTTQPSVATSFGAWPGTGEPG